LTSTAWIGENASSFRVLDEDQSMNILVVHQSKAFTTNVVRNVVHGCWSGSKIFDFTVRGDG